MLHPHRLACRKTVCWALICSVPAKGVLSHDRRRDLLSSDTSPLTAVTASAAPTAWSHAPVASTMHPSSRATRDRAIRHTAGAGDGAGTLVSDALVPVTAGNEEHGCAVCKSTDNGTAGNNGAG